MRAKKSLGQNFLMHPQIAARIVAAAALPPGAIVLEVGPGRGILTRALLAAGARVVAVEADAELMPTLRETFASEIETGRLELVHADIRTFDLASLPRDYHVVANIPYYITGELVRMLLSASHQPRSLTLLVQREVAIRIARDKKESILSLSVKAYGEPKYEFTVPRGAFLPAPKVDSAVLTIRGVSRRHFTSHTHEERFFTLLHAGFAHKRKLLSSNLASLAHTDALPTKVRAEDMPLSEWLALALDARAVEEGERS